MNKPLFSTLLVTAFLTSVTGGIAEADDTVPYVDTTAAQRQRMPADKPAPGRYPPPPPPTPGWQASPWGPPPGWATPPRGYHQSSPAYQADVKPDRTHTGRYQNPNLQNALSEQLAAATAENVTLESRVTQLTIELAESEARTQLYKDRLDDLNARLEDQKQAMLHARQLLAEMSFARDSLRADLSSSTEELVRVQTTLTKAQAQAEQLSQARHNALIAESPEQQESAPRNKPVLAENGAPAPNAVEIAVLENAGTTAQAIAEEMPAMHETKAVRAAIIAAQTEAADTDRDGVPDSIDLCPGTPEAVAVESSGCEANAAIPLDGVNFRYNSHELTGDARLVLDRVAGILGKNTDIRFEVAGHSDSQGDAAYNLWLSRQRAQAVRDYLVSRGLGQENITARGYGAQQPIADNTTVEGLVRNRRVELRRLP